MLASLILKYENQNKFEKKRSSVSQISGTEDSVQILEKRKHIP